MDLLSDVMCNALQSHPVGQQGVRVQSILPIVFGKSSADGCRADLFASDTVKNIPEAHPVANINMAVRLLGSR